MSAYLPADPVRAAIALAALAAIPVLGLGLLRVCAAVVGRIAAWALVLGGVAVVECAARTEPAGFRMIVIILALLWAMKAVVSVEARADGQPLPRPGRWLAFALLWPGMRPWVFVAEVGRTPGTENRRRALPGARRLVAFGAARLVVGAALILVAWTIARATGVRPGWTAPAAAGTLLTLLAGLSLCLHFGLFNVAAGLWQYVGVDCRPLFRAPLVSRSLGEFWGRRWNLAFSEMTGVAVYRPLAGAFGKPAATVAAFVFSGLLHELAISLPVLAGFGLPMLYFAVQGLLVLAERALARTGHPVERWGWPARLWTLGWVTLPLPILFHTPFVERVVLPLIGL